MTGEEMERAIELLINSDLSNQVARLAVETSHRVTVLEDKLR